MTIKLPLSQLTLDAVNAEALRAHLKHGDNSLLSRTATTEKKLAALVEEVGEVGRALTYDNDQGRDHLVKELIQTASVALSWVESLEGVPVPACEPAWGAAQVAEAFHETYERLAPEHGYQTRERSAVPWADVPEDNQGLMISVVRELLRRGVISHGR